MHEIEDIDLNELDKEDHTQFTTPKGKGKALPGDFIPTPSPTASSPDPLSMPTPPAKATRTRSSGRQSVPPKRFKDLKWDKNGKALLAIESSALEAIGVVAVETPHSLKT